MSRYPYDVQFTPPAPVIELQVSAPSRQGQSIALRGLIDSGADITVMPENAITVLALQYVDELPVAGFDGQSSVRPIYAARIHVQGTPSLIVKVVAISTEIVLLGRDLINRWRLLLDGRAQILDIS
jgi:predicted aspartyl protease